MDPQNVSTPTLVKYSDNGPIIHNLNSKPGEISVQVIAPGSVPLTPFYSNTLNGDYEAAGAALAGATPGTGTITLPALPAGSTIVSAFLFWDVIRFNGSSFPVNPNGILNGHPITGTLIGTADVGGILIDGFFSDVTSIAVPGANILTGFPTDTPAVYQTDGASLVVVFSNPNLPLKTVVINKGFDVFFLDSVFTTLMNFTAGNAPITAKTTYIVGQRSFGQDEALFNGTVVGTGVFNAALGMFWNNVNIDVSSLVNPGDTSAVAGIINNSENVLNWIAQVFSVNAVPTRGIDIRILHL